MKLFLLAVTSVALAVAIAPMMAAQWPDFPSPGVPLLPNGQPNMEGPAPKTADGKPDLSGIWNLARGAGGGGRGQGQGGGRGGGQRGDAAGGAVPTPAPAPPAPPPAANAGPP